MDAARNWRTLRELDEAAGRPKGTAFRAFRQLEPDLRAGADFTVLEGGADAARLKASRRAYASSVKVVLLSREAAARVLAAMP